MFAITVNRAFSFYSDSCRSRGVKQASLDLNNYAREYLIEYLGSDKDIASLDRFTLRQFFLWLSEEKHLSSATQSRIYDVCNAVFHFLSAEKLIESSPMAKVNKPRKESHIIKPLTLEQIQAMIDSCDVKTFTGIRNRLVITLLFDCGMRATELTSVDLSDVDVESRTILLRTTKGDRPRPAYFSSIVARLLAKYLLVRESLPGDKLIVTKDGNSVDRYWLRLMIMRVWGRAGIRVYPHLLRHSCAVASLKNGSNVAAVMRILGHSNPRMSLHYSQLADSDVQEIQAQTSPADRLIVNKKKFRKNRK